MISRYAAFIFVLSTLVSSFTFAQTTLVSADFNDCTIPNDWTVTYSNATAEAATFVTDQPDNTNSDSTTIDGSCMVLIDDDLVGNNTPFVNVKFTTPSFDATQYSTVSLDMDVVFRQYEQSFLSISVYDGTQYVELANFTGNNGQTGVQFSEFIHVSHDLTYYANPNMSIQIEYDDGQTWAWWAGFDNVVITGEGTATNLLVENFNACGLPSGWTTQVVEGINDWQFDGGTDNTNGSMNGSCMAYFDDDGLGQEAVFSTVQLISPVIDGSLYGNMYLDFSVIFRKYSELENLSVLISDGTTAVPIATYLDSLGGPAFSDYIHQQIDLSAYRSEQMQIIFQYDDGNDWGWWVGIDDVKVSGEGFINDLCTSSFELQLNQPCLSGNNENALFQGNQPSCTNNTLGALWYHFEAPSTGVLKIETNATYNDILTVFGGDCNNLTESICSNWDEFGFVGENLYLNMTAGSDYYIRVSGLDKTFGEARGDLCIQLEQVSAFPSTPTNDLCANAIPLTLNSSCLSGNNFDATFDGPTPSLNENSRADIWYQFTASNAGDFIIETQADFADVITVYGGTCNNFTEIASNDKGQVLELTGLTNNATYFVQVSGFFATVEGNVCMTVSEDFSTPPINDLCNTAQNVSVGGSCLLRTNSSNTFSGPAPSCEIFPAANIWFQFTVPPSGNLQINTGADFVHAVSIYSGDCNGLEEVYCQNNPLSCDGYFDVGGLNSGETYFMQIASAQSFYDESNTGTLCLQILDGAMPADFQPLELSVSAACEGDATARLNVQASGGAGSYTFEGNTHDEVLLDGEDYLVVVTDANGCQKAVSGTIACGDNTCVNSTESCACDDLSIEGNQMTTYVYQAANTIVSDATIEADMTYKAGVSITLEPGFNTILGHEFLALIETCEEGSSLMASTSDEDLFLTEKNKATTKEEAIVETTTTAVLNVSPNIITSTSQIEYSISESNPVSIEIHSLKGEKVSTITQHSSQEAGTYYLSLKNTQLWGAGIYYVVLQTATERVVRKIVVVSV